MDAVKLKNTLTKMKISEGVKRSEPSKDLKRLYNTKNREKKNERK